MKIKSIHILGVITVLELLITKEMIGSVLLWILYGFYKSIND